MLHSDKDKKWQGRSDKARAMKINKTSLPEGELVTLEEEELQLQLPEERSHEVTMTNRDQRKTTEGVYVI